MMTFNTNNKPVTDGSVESGDGVKSERNDRNTLPVPTRVGRNTVEIDVPALKHLVGTMKAKLTPGGKI
jgi:hypothetical protein